MAKSMFDTYTMADKNPLKVVTNHVNKKGRLTGSKKEKAVLRSICPHHVLDKKGRIKKAKLDSVDHGKKCQCRICQDKFKSGYYTDQEYEKGYSSFKEIISQAKMVAVAVGADQKSIQGIATLNLQVDRFGKVYRNLRKLGQKQDKVKGKKKRKRESGSMGEWRVN